MKCINPACRKIIRNKGANYCPFCGKLQHMYETRYHAIQLKDEMQATRIEKKLNKILEKLK